MNFEELLDLSLREVLDNYASVESLECGYFYGVVSFDDLEKLFEMYDIGSDCSSFYVDSLINHELIDKNNILGIDDLVKIMDNLGIDKK